jgi:ADP-ribosyl-[dinitrogen reductase] hydrolase
MAVFSILSKQMNKNVAQGMSIISEPTQMHGMKTAATATLEDRLRGALWAFMAGDALAAPTHWYYGGKHQIVQDYGRELTDYIKPKYHLAGSILNKSDLNGGGRSRGGSRTSQKTIIGDVINHGKQDLWSPSQSIHYHATLERGENTLEVQLARVLMKSIVENAGTFNADHFRDSYIKFMTTPNSHNDTYASTCHRMFFFNLVHAQLPPSECPDNDQHNVDTIDSLVLPTIVALAGSCQQNPNTAALTAQCLGVTRKSSISERIASQWAGVVHSALHDENDEGFLQTLDSFSEQTIRRLPNARASDSSTMSACYLSQSLPGMVDMLAKYVGKNKPWDALLANANVGGENVHRGSVMGAILGARASDSNLPSQLKEGLYHHQDIAQEIDDFVRAVLPKDTNDEKKEEL